MVSLRSADRTVKLRGAQVRFAPPFVGNTRLTDTCSFRFRSGYVEEAQHTLSESRRNPEPGYSVEYGTRRASESSSDPDGGGVSSLERAMGSASLDGEYLIAILLQVQPSLFSWHLLNSNQTTRRPAARLNRNGRRTWSPTKWMAV